ncbi:hypothetical protein BH23ACI1_BH23ACI1_27090 [soil metagenome]
MSRSRFAACTVIAKNHLPLARVLAGSFRRHHPGAPFHVLLADRVDGCFRPLEEPFEVLSLDDVRLPNLHRTCFQYDVFELTCAAKPYLIRTLLDRGVDQAVYLDADILLLGSLGEILDSLDTDSIVLTPHLTAGLPDDGRRPSLRDILDSGTFNGGMFAVRNDPSSRRFLDWLALRLARHGLADLARGQFVDQRWLNLVPGMFDGVHVLRYPGHNVGHWCLQQRQVQAAGNQWLVDGVPLRSFHFSGLPVEDVRRVSRHQDRVTLDDVPQLRPLFEHYRSLLLEAGYDEAVSWPYAFGSFDNGVPIPPHARRLYWSLEDAVERFGDPFETGSAGSYWSFLQEEVRPQSGISRFWHEVYLGRRDLQRLWPDVLGEDASAFREWVELHGVAELQGGRPFSVNTSSVAGVKPLAVAATTPTGVNLIGHARSEKGVGEALRASARALSAAAIPHVVVDFADPNSVNLDDSLKGQVRHCVFGTNIIHVNAEGFPYFVSEHGPRVLRGRYNIGLWMWELADFPAVFRGSFSYVDEVWVPSRFCLDALSASATVPVVRMPLALPAALTAAPVGRAHFGLPESACLFLFAFDAQSIVERKNPLGLVRAFRRAFRPDDAAALVLKVAHGTAATHGVLREEAKGARIFILDTLLDRAHLNALMGLCDCYVSLHRSEGFGLTMAEAMAQGKPVIATGYSGNTDFMTPQNSYLVEYTLTTLEEDLGPYPRGSHWAAPDLEHASLLMRRVFDAPAEASDMAERGRLDVSRDLSPVAVGARLKARLEVIEGVV